MQQFIFKSSTVDFKLKYTQVLHAQIRLTNIESGLAQNRLIILPTLLIEIATA